MPPTSVDFVNISIPLLQLLINCNKMGIKKEKFSEKTIQSLYHLEEVLRKIQIGC